MDTRCISSMCTDGTLKNLQIFCLCGASYNYNYLPTGISQYA